MSDFRVGIGVDAHAFSDGAALVVGGVEIPGEAGLAGHSDGDVVAHALVDAVLGAAALGDIGTFFPSDEPEWEGASSLLFLERAMAAVREAGFELVNADCVLVGERPRIAPLRAEMEQRLAVALERAHCVGVELHGGLRRRSHRLEDTCPALPEGSLERPLLAERLEPLPP